MASILYDTVFIAASTAVALVWDMFSSGLLMHFFSLK